VKNWRPQFIYTNITTLQTNSPMKMWSSKGIFQKSLFHFVAPAPFNFHSPLVFHQNATCSFFILCFLHAFAGLWTLEGIKFNWFWARRFDFEITQHFFFSKFRIVFFLSRIIVQAKTINENKLSMSPTIFKWTYFWWVIISGGGRKYI
jgi:hypothetical protein